MNKVHTESTAERRSLELANKVLVRSFGLLQLSLNDYLRDGESPRGEVS